MPKFQEKQKISFCGKQKPENYYHNNKKQLKYSVNYGKTRASFACQPQEL